ncbi:MAG: hypothetical protein ABFC24_00620 [Methanoregulaceae archaeon]
MYLPAVKILRIVGPRSPFISSSARIVEDRERQAASGKEIERLCEGLVAKAFAGKL